MQIQIQNASRIWFIFLPLIVMLLVGQTGCQKSSVSKGSSRNKGIQTSEPDTVQESFIHPDHFMAMVFRPGELKDKQALAAFPWEAITRLPGQKEGNAVFDIDQIESILVLFDGAKMQNLLSMAMIAANGEDVQPMDIVTILEGFNEELVQRSRQWLVNSSEYSKSDVAEELWVHKDKKWAVLLREDEAVCMGPPNALKKIMSNSQASQLAKVIERKGRLSAMAMVVDLSSFASLFETLEETARQFAGNKADVLGIYRKIKLIVANFDINGERIIEGSIEMEDQESANQFAGQLMQSLSEMLSASGSSLAGPGDVQSPIELRSSGLYKNVVSGLKPDDYKIELDETNVRFELNRPDQTDQLLEAISNDISAFARFNRRLEKAKQIAEGLKKYQVEHGRMPPADSVAIDSEKKLPPQFNWRVGILPYIDCQSLYDKFNFDEAWDSPHNLQVASEMPEVFDVGADPGKTTWIVLNGERCGYSNGTPLNPGEIKDRAKNTLMVCEFSESMQRAWTSPGRIDINDQFDFGMIGRSVDKFVLGITCDSRVIAIKRQDKIVEAFVTANGSENINRSMTFPTGASDN